MRPLHGGSPPPCHGPERGPPCVLLLALSNLKRTEAVLGEENWVTGAISTFSHFNAMSQINRPGFLFEEPDALNLAEPRGVGLGEPKQTICKLLKRIQKPAYKPPAAACTNAVLLSTQTKILSLPAAFENR